MASEQPAAATDLAAETAPPAAAVAAAAPAEAIAAAEKASDAAPAAGEAQQPLPQVNGDVELAKDAPAASAAAPDVEPAAPAVQAGEAASEPAPAAAATAGAAADAAPAGDVAAAVADAPSSGAVAVDEPAASSAAMVATASTGAESVAESSSSGTALAAAPASAAASPAATAAAPTASAATKKFTSLSVNRRFLEKASPSPPPSAVPAKASGAAPAAPAKDAAARIAATAPSRLMAAKLSAAAKPASPSWGSSGSPAPAGAAASSGGAEASSPAAAPASGAAHAASPRLTALSSARAGSPAGDSATPGRSSPGLRNAALGNDTSRTGAGGAAAAAAATAKAAAPWAIKPVAAAPASSTPFGRRGASNLASDFPTAAEAARAQAAAEERERAAAAEAAARAEAALSQLERFRGSGLGAGRHWDEMEDEDDGGFLDDVVEFGDGTQYKVPAASSTDKEQRPVSKEERFKDQGHDRSWPPRREAGAAAPAAASGRPAPWARSAADRDAPPHGGSTSAAHLAPEVSSRSLFPRAGARSISAVYDDDDGTEPGSLQLLTRDRRGGDMGRGSRRDRDGYPSMSAGSGGDNAPSVSSAAARAWGPLAQRASALNPDAPKPAPVPAPAAAAAASPSASEASAGPAAAANGPAAAEARPPPVGQRAPLPPPRAPPRAGGDRPLPPHLAAGWAPATPLSPERSAAPLSPPAARSTRAPWARADDSAAEPAPAAADAAKSPPAAAAAPADIGHIQREEMLSAAERARKRRQEEEEQRAKEKERALAKAKALEQVIEETRKKREAEDAEKEKKLREEQAARKAAQEERTKAAAAAAAAAQESKRTAAAKPQPAASAPAAPAGPRRDANASVSPQAPAAARPPVAPAAPSPSDEAVSWRRAAPLRPTPAPRPAAAPAARSPEQQSAQPAQRSNEPPRRTVLQREPAKAASPQAAPAAQAAQRSPEISAAAGSAPGAPKQTSPVMTQALPPGLGATPPTGPRALRNQERAERAAESAAQQARPAQTASSSNLQPQDSKPPRTPRVEVVAPTDEGAAAVAAAAASRRGKEAAAQPTASAMKQPRSPAAPRAVAEAPATRAEVPQDSPPVWNKFAVKTPSKAPAPKRLSKAAYRAQLARVAASQHASASAPSTVQVLTWDPPLHNLSSRTLSRDDLFFPKKYQKGRVITPVAVPTTTLPRGLPARVFPKQRQPDASAQLPNARKAAPQAPVAPQSAASAERSASSSAAPTPVVSLPRPQGLDDTWRRAGADGMSSVPTAPASMRSGSGALHGNVMSAPLSGTSRSPFRAALIAATSTTSGPLDDPHGHSSLNGLMHAPHRSGASRRDSGSGVAFARAAGQLQRERQDSPSFLVASELDVDGRAARNRGTSSQTQTPALPSPGQMDSSTWGQGPLTFPVLPANASGGSSSGAAESSHVKSLWAPPDARASAASRPAQNSLKGIADDPLSMPLSMLELGNAPEVDSPTTALPPSTDARRGNAVPSDGGRPNGYPHSSAPSPHAGRQPHRGAATGPSTPAAKTTELGSATSPAAQSLSSLDLANTSGGTADGAPHERSASHGAQSHDLRPNGSHGAAGAAHGNPYAAYSYAPQSWSHGAYQPRPPQGYTAYGPAANAGYGGGAAFSPFPVQQQRSLLNASATPWLDAPSQQQQMYAMQPQHGMYAHGAAGGSMRTSPQQQHQQQHPQAGSTGSGARGQSRMFGSRAPSGGHAHQAQSPGQEQGHGSPVQSQQGAQQGQHAQHQHAQHGAMQHGMSAARGATFYSGYQSHVW